MTTLWHKAIRDFWTERACTALVVLAIALGISAFASVLSSYAILPRELDPGYLDTNPASAVLRVDRVDDDLVAAILQNSEVSDAEPRRTVSGQIKAGPVQWRNLTGSQYTQGITCAEGWFISEGTLAPQTRFTVAALPVDTKLLDLEILAGRKLQPGDTDALVINNALAARAPALRVGETVTLQIGSTESWRVVGLAKEAYSPAVAYIPLNFIHQQQPGMVNSLRRALDHDDFDSISIVKERLDRNLEQQGVRARGSSHGRDAFQFRSAHGDDLRISDRHVCNRGQRRRAWTDDDDEPQRA